MNSTCLKLVCATLTVIATAASHASPAELDTARARSKKYRKAIRAERDGDVYNFYFEKIEAPKPDPSTRRAVAEAPESTESASAVEPSPDAEVSAHVAVETNEPPPPRYYEVYIAPITVIGRATTGGELGGQVRLTERFGIRLGVAGLFDTSLHSSSDTKATSSGQGGAGASLLALYTPFIYSYRQNLKLEISALAGVSYFALENVTRTKTVSGGEIQTNETREPGLSVVSPVGGALVSLRLLNRWAIDAYVRAGGHSVLAQAGLGGGFLF